MTVSPPAEPEFEVERRGDLVSLGMELEWGESPDDVDTETSVSRARFELYEDNAGAWRWRLVHTNGN